MPYCSQYGSFFFNVIDMVAEAMEKVAGEVTHTFPSNENLKEATSKIKTVNDATEEDAEKAEAPIQKVGICTLVVH